MYIYPVTTIHAQILLYIPLKPGLCVCIFTNTHLGVNIDGFSLADGKYPQLILVGHKSLIDG